MGMRDEADEMSPSDGRHMIYDSEGNGIGRFSAKEVCETILNTLDPT